MQPSGLEQFHVLELRGQRTLSETMLVLPGLLDLDLGPRRMDGGTALVGIVALVVVTPVATRLPAEGVNPDVVLL